MKDNEYNFRQELCNNMSLYDLVITGATDNIQELRNRLDDSKKKYHKKLLTWLTITTPLVAASIASTYSVDLRELTDYLAAGGIVSNVYFGMKAAIAQKEFASIKRTCSIGETIDDRLQNTHQ